jgi:hypothetical protein
MSKNKTNSGLITREALLNFKAQPRKFTIKDYGDVFVRTISSGERLKIQELYTEGNEDPFVPEKTVILGLCDDKGQSLFNDSDLESVKALPSDMVQGIALAVVRSNGMDPDAVKVAEGN